MTQIHALEFNPFAENTYVMWDESGECVIFDPGCYSPEECDSLKRFIEARSLKPVRLINTHCHLDHVFGNPFVVKTWGIGLEIHEGEWPVLSRFDQICQMYGIPFNDAQPLPVNFLNGGETLSFGHTKLKILYTPGHSPASISFYCEEEGFVVAGDVLFLESIGRTDLPGGDFDTLIKSIRTQLFTLPDETIVYSGHGPATTIRHEKEYNPFL